MTIFIGQRAKPTTPKIGHGYHGALYSIMGYYDVAANPVAADTYQLCVIPARFLLLCGQLQAAQIDTNATPTLSVSLGWQDNGDGASLFMDAFGTQWANAANGASATGLLAATVLSGKAVTDVNLAGMSFRNIALPKPLFFPKQTIVQVTANVTAATFAAGAMSVILEGNIIG